MGVDFYTCPVCEDTFPDCGEYYECEYCNTRFCSDKCANLKIIDPENEDDKNCQLCRKEYATDSELLRFMLKRSNLTRKQAEEIWRNETAKI